MTSHNTSLSFSNIVLEKTRADTNSRLKNFSQQNNVTLLSNDNIKEHLGIKKRHFNRKGNSIFARNLLQFTLHEKPYFPNPGIS